VADHLGDAVTNGRDKVLASSMGKIIKAEQLLVRVSYLFIALAKKPDLAIFFISSSLSERPTGKLD